LEFDLINFLFLIFPIFNLPLVAELFHTGVGICVLFTNY